MNPPENISEADKVRYFTCRLKGHTLRYYPREHGFASFWHCGSCGQIVAIEKRKKSKNPNE